MLWVENFFFFSLSLQSLAIIAVLVLTRHKRKSSSVNGHYVEKDNNKKKHLLHTPI